MFEDKSYEAHEDHKKVYDALEKLLERDYSDQLLSDLEEARQKKIKRRDVPRTPSGSPPPQPPPPPPPAGASGALGTSRALGSSQLPLPPPLLSTGTSGSTQQQGSKALSSSKSAALASQSMAWTTSNTQYEYAGLYGTQELSPMKFLIPDDSIPNEQVHLSDDEDSRNDHLPTANSRKGCGNHYLQRKDPKLLNLLGPFLLLMYQMLRTTGLLKGSSPALSISKMKAASYLDFGLELLLPKQISSILTDMILRHVEKKSDHTCGFSVSSKLKPTQDTVGFNSLVHSHRALSTLRRSDLRTASIVAKPCQGYSSKLYLITGSIHTDQRGTMVLATLYQPWRAILSMINMCLTGKTAGFDRLRHPVLQILWGIIHSSNIDYTERI
nr:hypothetical protein [Tanacetum cinerariifolium]